MNCPYCNSPVLLNDVAGNPWYQCGTTKTFRSASCVDREPIATELRNALDRIKRLEEAYEGEIGEQPELLGSNVMGLLKRELNFAQKRIKRLEEAGDELLWAFCPASVSMMTERESDALKLWNEAKEAKP